MNAAKLLSRSSIRSWTCSSMMARSIRRPVDSISMVGSNAALNLVNRAEALLCNLGSHPVICLPGELHITHGVSHVGLG